MTNEEVTREGNLFLCTKIMLCADCKNLLIKVVVIEN